MPNETTTNTNGAAPEQAAKLKPGYRIGRMTTGNGTTYHVETPDHQFPITGQKTPEAALELAKRLGLTA